MSRYRDAIPIPTSPLADDVATASSGPMVTNVFSGFNKLSYPMICQRVPMILNDLYLFVYLFVCLYYYTLIV